MLAFHSPSSRLTGPRDFFRHGGLVPHPENGQRYEVLLEAVIAGGHDIRVAPDHGLAPVLAVHDPAYVDFLARAWPESGRGDDDDALVATQFARIEMHHRPEGLQGRLGYYLADTSTAIHANSWTLAYGSAQAAIAAADQAAAGGDAYALCRPPGHHAYAACAGGFCFLNNSAIAAERLRKSFDRVAMIDVDVHHGNGTQGIFYARADVLTVSLHADPADFFPHYAGYADERGTGDGMGFNRNLPLRHGGGDEAFLGAIGAALDAAAAFGAEALVIPLGLDASEQDPIGVMKVTTDGFARAGALLAQFDGPTVLVQEGGYLCSALPENLTAFLRGFEQHRSA